MKAKLFALALGTTMSMSAAIAGPVQALPGGPLYMKFNGSEQVAIAENTYTYNAGGQKEINWGVFVMTDVFPGAVDVPHSTIDVDGAAVISSTKKSQITGMFYGITAVAPNTGGSPFPATGGFLDLYWRDLELPGMIESKNSTATPGMRTAFDKATGYTDGQLLVRIKFSSGINVDPTVFINGSQTPVAGGAFPTGVATSFGNVDIGAGGEWASRLNGDWFNTAFGTRDVRFRNNYEYKPSWNGNGIVGLKLDDPAQAFAIPEPSVLGLMGLALLGMGAARRRRNK